MADIFATLFRFRLFIFEYGPFFLAAWLGLAMTTGLITVALKKRLGVLGAGGSSPRSKLLQWLWRLLVFLLWRPVGKMPGLSTFSGALFFGLAASVPSLVATSLIGMNIVWLRLILAVPYALLLNRLFTRIPSRKEKNSKGQQLETGLGPQSEVSSDDILPLTRDRRPPSVIQVVWKSFTGQIEGAVIPLVIGLSLASALTIYIPAYTIRPWLGEGAWQGPYLAAFLIAPFQLTGGAEVLLASALLVKGASLGTALSLILAAPVTAFSVIRRLYQPVKVKTMVLYFVVAWLAAGSLGAAVDGIQRVLDVW